MKIDTSSIANYENMTPEEKIAALEAMEIPETVKEDKTDTLKLKNALNKATSEAADYKRQLQEHMSEEQRKELERKEAQERMVNELNTLKQEKMIAGYKATYLTLGYDEALAEDTAKALANGEMDKVFSNQKIAQENAKKTLREQELGKQPPLTNGKPLTPQEIEDQMTAKLEKAMYGY